jgi:transposase
MFSISLPGQIYVYTESIDMRRSINGLVILLADVFEQNPQTGDLFIFTNKQRNKLKALFWDKNGFVLYYKRIEKGRFQYSKHLQGNKIIVNPTQLRALLMGLDFHLLGQYPIEHYQDFI